MEEILNDQPVFVDVDSGLNEGLIENGDGELNVKVENNSESGDDEFSDLLQIQPRKIRCPECQRYTAETAEKMTKHILKVHRGEDPYQCFMCDYTTPNKVNFEDHIRRHEGVKPFKCAHCPHTNVSKKNLKKHELIHRADNPLKCPHCDFIAQHRRAFTFHAKRFHRGSRDGGLTCVKCDRSFDSEEALKVHRKYQKACFECKFVACNNIVLNEHYHRKHGKRMFKKNKCVWTCAICGWQGSKPPKILLHLIHHPNQDVGDMDVTILKRHGIL